MSRNLAVFDFDHTIINDNSDVVAINMVDSKKIPREVKELHKSDGWTAFMQKVFEILHKNNIQEKHMKKVMQSLPAIPGMLKLIKELKENLNYDIIVISDSNSYFIDSWLNANDLSKQILRVFTNPAHFENGLLKIEMYHFQDTCKLSTKNLCKGQIMEDFIANQKKKGFIYNIILYCGDGINDFCPILRLRTGDICCVRNKYKCMDLVKKAKDGIYTDSEGIPRTVKSRVIAWNSGFEIIDYIKSLEKI